jgi:hypothetical protein
MANRQVVFPTDKQTEAQAYCDWTGLNWPGYVEADPSTHAFAEVGEDAYGQWVVAYLGPPFEYPVGTPCPEPSGGPAMRAAGVIATPWPIEEE